METLSGVSLSFIFNKQNRSEHPSEGGQASSRGSKLFQELTALFFLAIYFYCEIWFNAR